MGRRLRPKRPDTPGSAGDSGRLPGNLRTKTREAPHGAHIGEGRRLRSGGPETPVQGGDSAHGRRLVDDASQGRRLRSIGPDTPATRTLRAPSDGTPDRHQSRTTHLAKGRKFQGPETPAWLAGNSGQEKSCSKESMPFLPFLVNDAKGKNIAINLQHLTSY